MLIQQPRRLLIFKRFVLHDVAPVAGGITDREKDWLLLAARFFKRLGTPWKPIHGIVLVLQEVRRFLAREAVGVRRGRGHISGLGNRRPSEEPQRGGEFHGAASTLRLTH